MRQPSHDPPSEPEAKPKPRRQLRNYLVDPVLQLRLGGYLVAVAVVLSAALGFQIWRAHRTASELVALGDPRADEVVAALFASEDRSRLLFMSLALVALALGLMVLSLAVTHRIAGPAHALARACRAVGRGSLARPRPIRKADYLRALAGEVGTMVAALREREEGERARLAEAAALLESAPEQARAIVLEVLREKERRLRS